MSNRQPPRERIRYLSAKNVGVDLAPAYGLVRIASVDVSDEHFGAFHFSKPSANNQDCFIVGPAPIHMNDFGDITADVPCMALYDKTDGTPGVDDVWGVASGGYKLRSGKTGFIIKGIVDASAGIAMVIKQGGGGGGGGGGTLTVKLSDDSKIVSSVSTVRLHKDHYDIFNGGGGNVDVYSKYPGGLNGPLVLPTAVDCGGGSLSVVYVGLNLIDGRIQ